MSEVQGAVLEAYNPALINSAEIELIISNNVIAASGVGLVPVPVVDLVGVGVVQLRMMRKLAEAYGVEYSDKRVRSVLMALIGGSVPALGALPFFSLVQSIPVIGWSVGACASSILSGASTYAVGHIVRRHFEAGGDFENFDSADVREAFDSLIEKGKSVTKKLGRKSNAKKASTVEAV